MSYPNPTPKLLTKLSAISKETIRRMSAFNLSKEDLDIDGYLTLYHGGKTLPSTLKKGEILFLTESKELAEDYARMRKGKVFTLKAKPDDLFFNIGSYEIEYSKGGKIINGVITPPAEKVKIKPSGNVSEYRGVKRGDTLPKTGYKVLDIHTPGGPATTQFLLDTGEGKTSWFHADTVVDYEF